jgi:hypothetical protein
MYRATGNLLISTQRILLPREGIRCAGHIQAPRSRTWRRWSGLHGLTPLGCAGWSWVVAFECRADAAHTGPAATIRLGVCMNRCYMPWGKLMASNRKRPEAVAYMRTSSATNVGTDRALAAARALVPGDGGGGPWRGSNCPADVHGSQRSHCLGGDNGISRPFLPGDHPLMPNHART